MKCRASFACLKSKFISKVLKSTKKSVSKIWYDYMAEHFNKNGNNVFELKIIVENSISVNLYLRQNTL